MTPRQKLILDAISRAMKLQQSRLDLIMQQFDMNYEYYRRQGENLMASLGAQGENALTSYLQTTLERMDPNRRVGQNGWNGPNHFGQTPTADMVTGRAGYQSIVRQNQERQQSAQASNDLNLWRTEQERALALNRQGMANSQEQNSYLDRLGQAAFDDARDQVNERISMQNERISMQDARERAMSSAAGGGQQGGRPQGGFGGGGGRPQSGGGGGFQRPQGGQDQGQGQEPRQPEWYTQGRPGPISMLDENWAGRVKSSGKTYPTTQANQMLPDPDEENLLPGDPNLYGDWSVDSAGGNPKDYASDPMDYYAEMKKLKSPLKRRYF